LHHGDNRVRRTQVDSDNLTHSYLPFLQNASKPLVEECTSVSEVGIPGVGVRADPPDGAKTSGSMHLEWRVVMFDSGYKGLFCKWLRVAWEERKRDSSLRLPVDGAGRPGMAEIH
jgi:hypothetical protein